MPLCTPCQCEATQRIIPNVHIPINSLKPITYWGSNHKDEYVDKKMYWWPRISFHSLGKKMHAPLLKTIESQRKQRVYNIAGELGLPKHVSAPFITYFQPTKLLYYDSHVIINHSSLGSKRNNFALRWLSVIAHNILHHSSLFNISEFEFVRHQLLLTSDAF